MRNIFFKKGLVIGIIFLFIGMSINSSTGSKGEDHNNEIIDKIKTQLKAICSVDNDTEYYALLIGMGIYAFNHQNDDPSMAIEVEDLKERLLVSEHWKEENIKVITKRRATFLNVIRGFRWLDRKENENDISVVCISTHGYQLDRDKFPLDEEDGRDEILITYLGGLYPWLLNIRDDFFSLLLSTLDSKGVCIVIGACYAGGFNDTPFTKTQTNNKINTDKFSQEFAAELSESGRVIIMACQEDELSYSGFIHFFTDGLIGYADANEDDMVSAEEAFEYAKEIYMIYQDNESHPIIFDDYPGELQLTVDEFPPSVPVAPIGQVIGDTNTTYNYSTVSVDPGGDNISYGWDWDDDYTVDEWTDFIPSNTTINISHSWAIEKTYNIRAIAKDEHDQLSDWSDTTVVIMCDDHVPDQQQTMIHSGVGLGGTYGVAMSFVPSLSTLSKVDLALFSGGPGDPKPLPLYIRDNLTGENLAEVSSVIPEMEDLHMTCWFTFDFQDIEVIPGNTYYIILRDIENWAHYWKCGKGNCYPYGRMYLSKDGEEWTAEGPDLSFVTWGVKT